eukprot:TRINITY_DN21537_c0_g1_i1.p1 TRINITY_DN21537_c0_g1~~TRINITY_DN21537_c0_g1_i1.p1  ORF type:complete len:646 (+),score=195.68 TRINITY_DN21537_c0_g1_i1:80-2017(+)
MGLRLSACHAAGAAPAGCGGAAPQQRRAGYQPRAFSPAPSLPPGGRPQMQFTGTMWREEHEPGGEFRVRVAPRRRGPPPDPQRGPRGGQQRRRDRGGDEQERPRRMPLAEYLSPGLELPQPWSELPQEATRVSSMPTPCSLRQAAEDARRAKAAHWADLLRGLARSPAAPRVLRRPPPPPPPTDRISAAVARPEFDCVVTELLPGGVPVRFNAPPADNAAGSGGDWLWVPCVGAGTPPADSRSVADCLGIDESRVRLHESPPALFGACRATRVLSLRGVEPGTARSQLLRAALLELGPHAARGRPRAAPAAQQYQVTVLLSGVAAGEAEVARAADTLAATAVVNYHPPRVCAALVPGPAAALAVGAELQEEAAAAALRDLIAHDAPLLRPALAVRPDRWRTAALQELARCPGAAALGCLLAADFDAEGAARELQHAAGPLLPCAAAVAAAVWDAAAAARAALGPPGVLLPGDVELSPAGEPRLCTRAPQQQEGGARVALPTLGPADGGAVVPAIDAVIAAAREAARSLTGLPGLTVPLTAPPPMCPLPPMHYRELDARARGVELLFDPSGRTQLLLPAELREREGAAAGPQGLAQRAARGCLVQRALPGASAALGFTIAADADLDAALARAFALRRTARAANGGL